MATITKTSDSHGAGNRPQYSMQVKIMYWGPGEAGKTTNYEQLKKIFKDNRISQGFSIATTQQRTLWSDSIHFRFFLQSLNLELIVLVATTTGQERFLSTREYILQNADGVIFVGDSHPDKLGETKRSFEELVAFTRANGIPILIQLNKRDVRNAIAELDFRKALGLPALEKDGDGHKIVYPAIATDLKRLNEIKEIFLDLIAKILKRKLARS
jgi:signal recognition particle receptor subunit beta